MQMTSVISLAEQHDLMQTVCQQLNNDSAVDSGQTPPNIIRSTGKNKRKKKNGSDDKGDDDGNKDLLN